MNCVALSNCAHAVIGWHNENDLILNAAKTEALALGTLQQVARMDVYGGMVVSGSTIPFGKKPRILVVGLNNQLTCVVQACNYHLRNIRPHIFIHR